MKARKIPMRQCIGCHESKPKSELIRVIKTPENEVLLDCTGKKNGRGAYICSSVECFNKARKSKAFARAFELNIPDDVYEDIERRMLQLVEK
ncbi:MAG: YlxR family protein [Lachnospiraceae bacterium]|nr:YlxR family protein [Lachnospiraceae bacterium]